MINNTDYREQYPKNTNFIIMDASNRCIPFDSTLITEHKLLYFNKNANDNDIAFAFYTFNNCIMIVKEKERYLVKYYNCNHYHNNKLAGTGYEELENDPDGWQWVHYYISLSSAVNDSIKAILDDEININIYGYMETQCCNDDYIINTDNNNIIRDARLRRLYFSQASLY